MDEIVRAVSADGFVRITAAVTRDIVERARQIHQTLPVVYIILKTNLQRQNGKHISKRSVQFSYLRQEAITVPTMRVVQKPAGLAFTGHQPFQEAAMPLV